MERTPEQYAIEHGRYLADAARNLQVAINARDDTQISEAWGALSSAIYEFEKRADRAYPKPST